MDEFKALQKKRRLKQLLMAGPFLVIVIAGWRYPLLGYFIPLCMILGVSMGLFKGRVFCNWLCPRGSFYDVCIKACPTKALRF
ncbi:MAG: 4Fe-4S binding protein [Candidatus Omnitrophota bacterium]